MVQSTSKIELTYKSKDTEEFIDVYFYRPVGYILARFSHSLRLTPNSITFASIFVGVAAGHLFYYNNFTVNLIGIFLLIIANLMDSVDGQLARMANICSRYGRILDGFGGNLWFFSIYIHITLRLIDIGFSPAVFLIILLAGISHSFQSAYADYYRNHYLFFVYGKKRSEIDDSATLKMDYGQLSWFKHFPQKFLMRVYINYTLQQEMLSKYLLKLYNYAAAKFRDGLPENITQVYRSKNKPLVKYFNILTTNTRMFILFISILSGHFLFYFLFELIVLNLLLVYVINKHEKNSKETYQEICQLEM
ncbi:MAG: CDP-alcohol phosphatidyltransferase [Stygiobacter sp.]|nr:MAG: CDP-alcohol phosphatidyltransferase [Stygiobacter sp.]KAF0218032.1 MAG: CDP-alcohol [Ignavibacteria bacterium]